MGSRDGICQGKAQRHRGIRGISVEESDAGHGLCQQVLTRLFNPGTLGAVACDRSVNNAGVDDLYGFIIQAHAGHNAGPEIGDHHVCLRDQLLDPFQILWVLQIGRIALLAAIDDLEIDGVSISHKVLQRQLPSGIAHAGALDLDDSGPQITQPHSRRGAGQKLAKIQDCNSIQQFHFCSPLDLR